MRRGVQTAAAVVGVAFVEGHPKEVQDEGAGPKAQVEGALTSRERRTMIAGVARGLKEAAPWVHLRTPGPVIPFAETARDPGLARELEQRLP